MDIKLLHHTPDYSKLVEMVARVCYQSYGKVNEESQKMIKSIMKKGHLSIASVGNIVWGINFDDKEQESFYYQDLVTMKQINNFVRWTTKDIKKNPHSKYDLIISMNVLALLDIVKNIGEYEMSLIEDNLFNDLLESLQTADDVRWFMDNDVKLPQKENPYHVQPTLNNPVVLTEDYNALKDELTEYELDIHATTTVDYITDRASGLQLWRHGDQTGGCELSQRYVSRSNANYRIPVDMVEEDELDLHNHVMKQNIQQYEQAFEFYKSKGIRTGRAKELARNYLPNIETRIIQCRPIRQWKHLIALRDSPHAQKEVAEDVRAIRSEFNKLGIDI